MLNVAGVDPGRDGLKMAIDKAGCTLQIAISPIDNI